MDAVANLTSICVTNGPGVTLIGPTFAICFPAASNAVSVADSGSLPNVPAKTLTERWPLSKLMVSGPGQLKFSSNGSTQYSTFFAECGLSFVAMIGPRKCTPFAPY
jgi:hypothetical protein